MKQNAPAREGEGVECRFPGDIDAYSTVRARFQYLRLLGLHPLRADILAPLVFGEAAQ